MSIQLESLVITDFRCIRGSIRIPLSSPIVLIHGMNGVGKTSTLSALELALTGEILAMRRIDSRYHAHLRHRDASSGSIVLNETVPNTLPTRSHEMIVGDDGIKGIPALTTASSRFFSERCYLAQATLGRLLEIYQDAEARQDSPLTRFVKDLLGLDHLDSLADGLHSNADVRNLRRFVPVFAEAESELASVNRRLTDFEESLSHMADDKTEIRKTFEERLVELGIDAEWDTDEASLARYEVLLEQVDDDTALVQISASRRDLAGIGRRIAELSQSESSLAVEEAESIHSAAQQSLLAWQESAGVALSTILDQVRGLFPDIPSITSTDPETAVGSALLRVEADLKRCSSSIELDDAVAVQIEVVERKIAECRARIALADEQLAEIAVDTASLGRAIAALAPHIHSELCPVCGRDFTEVSNIPLVERVSMQAARLTEEADRLQNLNSARQESLNDLVRSEREREATLIQRLPSETRAALKQRQSKLSEFSRSLSELAHVSKSGAILFRSETESRGRLIQLRTRDIASAEVRDGIKQLCLDLRQPPLGIEEPVEDALRRLETFVALEEDSLIGRQTARRAALASLRKLRELNARIAQVEEDKARTVESRRSLDSAFQTVERRRQAIRAVARAAAATRTAIVSRVFNGALNKIWRDLFVRIAPNEPFVPAFRLPQTLGEQVTAQLETVHRDGGRSGAPGTILSAGNLNTAALTLFTALHLAAKPSLPWLIFDDPVQSMDDVHITQFAALLRILAKTHGRKIIMAIHERQLFEYLALELSPAFEGDQLVTVELSRTSNGMTIAEPSFKNWEPDPAVAA